MYNNYNSNNKKFFICFALSLLVIGLFSFKSVFRGDSIAKDDKNQEASIFTPTEETYDASILAVGDIMVYNNQLTAQYDVSKADYSFDNNFKYVKDYIEKADYSMANLETTLTGNKVYKYSSYPKFNSPDKLADGLKYAGFDLLSTANNHAYDKGDLSIKNTLATLKEKNLDVVGTRENSTDDEFIVKNINNISVGITTYSYGKITTSNKYINDKKISDKYKDNVNIFDSSDVNEAFKTINLTLEKMKDTDLQIVYLHWGDKYSKSENDFQSELAQKLCDAGVDVILGSHPHVIQPVKNIKSTDGKNETIIAYSLGNFLSDQTRDKFNQYTEDGLMISIDISKKVSDKEAKVTKVTCVPTWLNRYYNSESSKYVYEIIPLANKEELSKINNLPENKIKKSYENTYSLIETSDLITIVENPFK